MRERSRPCDDDPDLSGDRQLKNPIDSRQMSPCLSSSELEDLVAGRLSDERHAALDGHVQNCASCQAALEALDEPQDAFFSAVRELATLAVIPRAVRSSRKSTGSNLCNAAGDLPFSSNGSDPLVDGTLGDFRIVRQVARGGMGIVYEARQISLGRRVALKVLAFAGLLDPRRMQRFQNEVRAAASLEHPHIVPVYAVGSDRGVYYYAMRFIDGPNLAEIIEQLRDRMVSAPGCAARAKETATMPGSAATIRDGSAVVGQRRRLVVRMPRSDDGRPRSAQRLFELAAFGRQRLLPSATMRLVRFWERASAGCRDPARFGAHSQRRAVGDRSGPAHSTTPTSGASFIGTSNLPT